ncbi:DUF72 domain-containing protein [Leucothrix arctica]|uniref:DUF72 domain-containing protein n=1 Tax=Leucothrix arctica TaxID=1481894 RepID=UPI001304B3F0|nr:DUF72 domain-containing protein [Leucothrix arctica]
MSKQPSQPRPYKIGLPQWHHPEWYAPDQRTTDSLTLYSQHFTSVEGNHSFYGVPSEASVAQWVTQTPDDFRFCFKFPRSISHSGELLSCDHLVVEFLQRIAPLEDRIGIIWLQLSQQFAPQHLSDLNVFLSRLPSHYTYAVEVRNLRLFDKSDNERLLNQILMRHKVNRVIFDTRCLFANMKDDDETRDAKQKKPRVPTHVIATGEQPLVRFISPVDINLAHTSLSQWVKKFIQWIDEGKTPWMFFHTPGNQQAPELAQWFAEQLHVARPDIAPLSLWDKQPKQGSLL